MIYGLPVVFIYVYQLYLSIYVDEYHHTVTRSVYEYYHTVTILYIIYILTVALQQQSSYIWYVSCYMLYINIYIAVNRIYPYRHIVDQVMIYISQIFSSLAYMLILYMYMWCCNIYMHLIYIPRFENRICISYIYLSFETVQVAYRQICQIIYVYHIYLPIRKPYLYIIYT